VQFTHFPHHVTVSCLLMVLLAAGCGPRGLARYSLEGTVTFDGKPVPGGQVILEPDSGADNRGPGAYCDITDGRFTTPPGRGHVGGPHRLRIMGFVFTTDTSTGDRMGRPLFPPYDMRLDLPRANARQDVIVPTPAQKQPPPPR
jgi:hypothetical protein